MYPIMRKNVIRRWTTLSLIDKGESSAEMIQMAHMQSSAAAGKGEKKTKKKKQFQRFVLDSTQRTKHHQCHYLHLPQVGGLMHSIRTMEPCHMAHCLQ